MTRGQGVLDLDHGVRVELRAWLDGLSGIARTVNQAAPMKELLDIIASTTCDLAGYDFSAILLPDDQRTALLIVGSYGIRPEYIREVNTRHPIRIGPSAHGEAPTSRAFRYQRPVHIRDVWEADSCAPWEVVAHEQGNRSLLSLPLMTSHGPLGVLNCYTRVTRGFSGDDIVFMETLANQAALAIEAATLRSNERARTERLDSLNRELRKQQNVLRKAEEGHHELMRLVLEDNGFGDLARSLGRTTSSIVIITDERGRIVAASPPEFPEALRRYVTYSVAPPAESAAEEKREPFARVLRLPVRDQGAGLPTLAVPVRADGELISHLWVVRPRPEEPHSPTERRIVEGAAILAALMLSKQRIAEEAEWRVHRDLLDELLLRGDRLKDLGVFEWGQTLGVDLRQPHVLLVTGPTPAAPTDLGRPDDPTQDARARALLGEVQRALRDTRVRAAATVRGGEAIVLCPVNGHDQARSRPTELARRLQRVLHRTVGNVIVAISPECERAEDYPPAYESARRALWLAGTDGGRDIIDVRRLGVYRVLLSASQPGELARFAKQLLGPLEEHEVERDGALLRTLRIFLDRGGSATAAARELFVHTNTVRYRIRRVEELLDVSLSKDKDRLQVALALMIREAVSRGPQP
ncbi:MAG: helix-turn-helix domain-containing protein [Nocardioidaceae bacterium]